MRSPNRNGNVKSAQYNSLRRSSCAPAPRDSFLSAVSLLAECAGEAIYEKRRKKAREAANAPIIIRSKGKRKTFPISAVFYIGMFAIVFAFLTYNYSVINNISYENENIKTQISELTERNEQLTLELDQRNNLQYIEEVATTKLGMVKSSDVEAHYVTLAQSDNIVVTDNKDTSTRFETMLNSFNNMIGKLYD